MMIERYVRAKSLEEAYTLNQSRRNRVIGGMLWLKMSKASVNTAVDLCDLGLDTIEETQDSFSIGAMVTLRQLEMHKGLNALTCGAVAKAVRDIVGVQFRNLATIGGSVYSRFGFSDVLTVLMALDCDVEMYKGGVVPIADFAKREPDRDILVRVIIRKTPGKTVYQAMRNARTDFPILTCAASKTGGVHRVVIGARPSRAMLVEDRDGLLAHGVTAESARAFADYAAEHVQTGSNTRASAAYRTHLVRVLCERALTELGGMDDGN